jgi:TRAP-type C4-dicarboxylate transport system permease small subunit
MWIALIIGGVIVFIVAVISIFRERKSSKEPHNIYPHF